MCIEWSIEHRLFAFASTLHPVLFVFCAHFRRVENDDDLVCVFCDGGLYTDVYGDECGEWLFRKGASIVDPPG